MINLAGKANIKKHGNVCMTIESHKTRQGKLNPSKHMNKINKGSKKLTSLSLNDNFIESYEENI